MNEDGIPFMIVEDNIFDINSITVKLAKIVHVNISDDIRWEEVAKNIEIIAINSGKAQFSSVNF